MSFIWPDGKTAAVSLRFDDGLPSHIDLAVPMLEAHGFRGTFYLCPAGTEEQWRQRVLVWKPIDARGHEIGNHSLSHPVPSALAEGTTDTCYEKLSLEAYEEDVLEAQRRLSASFDRQQWTYCYPCYETDVGVGCKRQSVVPFIAQHFIAATAGSEISQPYNDPEFCDLYKLLAVKADGLTAAGIIRHIEQCVDKCRWVIVVYHGIGQGQLAVSPDAFVEVLAFLADRQPGLWIAPIAEISAYIASKRD
jgi:hypothetical protein